MTVYKYRGSDDRKIFERDLNSIERNYFWASDFSNLNDPCETTITSDQLINQSKFVLPFFGKNSKEKFKPVLEAVDTLLAFTRKIGIYSLSKTYNDELLWAHYANSHKGFCIEYDLDILLQTYKSNNIYQFPVVYKKNPPSIDFQDVIKSSESDTIVRKMAGYKSLRWKYEEEIRIVIDDFGIHSYDYQALKSIYFGLRMPEKDKLEIMKRLSGRGINYFQIERIPETYKFKREPIEDSFYKEPNYFTEIIIPDSKEKPCKVKITEKNYWKYKKKADIRIELERPISESELRWLAVKIREEIFYQAELIGMFYYLKDDIEKDFAWATSHYQNEEYKINIMNW
ncbi:DUF2971 domain-containing protein [Winogradskyella sp. R77965]|uniref:DUF2971 domain-containing protein n=1 Tax=Winogradskyella sp. R77965 TaxID=3093872 RepID=UPI0037DD804B